MNQGKSSSAQNIVFIDYTSSSHESGYIQDSNAPNSLFALMKNRTVLVKGVKTNDHKVRNVINEDRPLDESTSQ